MTESPNIPVTPAPPAPKGHPRGLYTLFFTEMWERFSYYGMRAMLVLFMTDSIRNGMGLVEKEAKAIYGLYTAAVYLISLPGGWLADRLWGAQKAVWYGGLIIAAGHFTLAIPKNETFYFGLVLVAIGSGILKPNMSALVGELYPEGGSRRDAGFTIFYMGVNLGAFIGPLVCSQLGEKVNWHYGFAAAGVGMILGLVQFKFSKHLLAGVGTLRGDDKPLHLIERWGLILSIAALVLCCGLGMSGVIKFNPVAIVKYMSAVLLAIAVIYFLYLFRYAGLNGNEKQRVGVILVLFVASALFWCGFEQAGSTFNLFAQDHTARQIGSYLVPAGWFQSLGPIFVIVCAPIFASIWVTLARRNLDPSIPVKFGLGLIMLAIGLLIMAGAAVVVARGDKAMPLWLIMTYLVHTFGEMCLSPVGLSSVTKLSPRRFVGQMMGVWFLATSVGNLLAGLLSAEFSNDNISKWPSLYLKFSIIPIVTGVLLIAFAKPIKKLMIGIK
jgi:POT family proton-dependent oligopeptide transporter